MQPEYVGALAQSVEQQTENLCVPGSIPGGTTTRDKTIFLFCPFFNFLQKPVNTDVSRGSFFKEEFELFLKIDFFSLVSWRDSNF